MTDPVAQPDPYSRATPPAQLRAPEGTDPYTTWIWLILAIPVVQTLPIFFIDWETLFVTALTDPSGFGPTSAFLSPAYTLLVVLGWVGTGLLIWFAYLDWRELQRRGVPQPFHWAYIFLTLAVSSAVYTIGRSVVVKRRTGRGLAPMWISIATIVAGFVLGIVFAIVLTQVFVNSLDLVSFGP
jgi:hypothetical protein